MVETFINPTIGTASQLGVSLFEDTEPFEMVAGSSQSEFDTLIKAIYRQVLGNTYLMESERPIDIESKLKADEISVREFVRQLAQSEVYRSRFFLNCPRYRAIELNFKHLLGRAPESYQEMQYHSQLLDEDGYEVEIDSYVDSDEYQSAFGENIVPYYRGYKTQTGKKILGFPNIFKLLPSASSSDLSGEFKNQPRLTRAIIYNNPQGKQPVTDINQLLADVFRSSRKLPPTPVKVAPDLAAKQELQRQCEEQENTIKTLKQQLAQLQSFANIASLQLNKWQSSYSTTGTVSDRPSTPTLQSQIPSSGKTVQEGSYLELQQRSEQQKQEIAALQEKIADSRRLATFGESQLNKWRGRFF